MIDIAELKRRYLEVGKENGISKKDIKHIENILELILPDDFKNISKFFNGGCLGVIDNYCFRQGKANNIIEETRRLRNTINLPKQFIVLAEPPESIIVMDVVHKPSIIWCDATDIYNLKNKSFINKPDVWQDYSDFLINYYLMKRKDKKKEESSITLWWRTGKVILYWELVFMYIMILVIQKKEKVINGKMSIRV